MNQPLTAAPHDLAAGLPVVTVRLLQAPHDTAAAFAPQRQATLAVGHGSTSPPTPWSLSPAGLRRARFTPRLVLPSPDGYAIAAASSAAASKAQIIVAGSLRNAAAAGPWLAEQRLSTFARPVTVIAAGERWPDRSVCPALEDLLGAGMLLPPSPAAAAARGVLPGDAARRRSAVHQVRADGGDTRRHPPA